MLTIPRPCPVPWEEMQGDDVRRRCARCDCDVHDVSTLSRAEAARVIARRACVQVRFARPGWLRFRDGLVATVLVAGLGGCLRGKVLPPPAPEASAATGDPDAPPGGEQDVRPPPSCPDPS